MTNYGNGPGRTDWRTPGWLINIVTEAFRITHDLAADSSNALAENYIDIHEDLLLADELPGYDEADDRLTYAWLNPPFIKGGQTAKYVAAGVRLCEAHGMGLVCLLPASVGSLWWHTHVFRRFGTVAFPRRVHYDRPGGNGHTSCMFDSSLLIRHPEGLSRQLCLQSELILEQHDIPVFRR